MLYMGLVLKVEKCESTILQSIGWSPCWDNLPYGSIRFGGFRFCRIFGILNQISRNI